MLQIGLLREYASQKLYQVKNLAILPSNYEYVGIN